MSLFARTLTSCALALMLLSAPVSATSPPVEPSAPSGFTNTPAEAQGSSPEWSEHAQYLRSHTRWAGVFIAGTKSGQRWQVFMGHEGNAPKGGHTLIMVAPADNTENVDVFVWERKNGQSRSFSFNGVTDYAKTEEEFWKKTVGLTTTSKQLFVAMTSAYPAETVAQWQNGWPIDAQFGNLRALNQYVQKDDGSISPVAVLFSEKATNNPGPNDLMFVLRELQALMPEEADEDGNMDMQKWYDQAWEAYHASEAEGEAVKADPNEKQL